MAQSKAHIKREPLFRVTQKTNASGSRKFMIRLVATLLSFLVILIVLSILTKDSFGLNLQNIFLGSFGEGESAPITQNTMFSGMMMLLVLALGLAPAFKMKFWNIGAQGQALMGCLLASIVVKYLGGKVNNDALLFIAFLAAIIAGGIWALIPAIAKVKLQANETLFTLMMNYIAVQIVYCFMDYWKGKIQQLPPFEHGAFDPVGSNAYGLMYILVSLLTVAMLIYMSKTKHGYEISVVGESINTARYAGINTTKVILRTIFLSGAICAFAGFLYLGNTHTLRPTADSGYGFTAIIVAWGAHFNPIAMVVISFIIVFLQRGAVGVQNEHSRSINGYLSYIIVGIFLFFLIGCEFFLNYKLVWNSKIVEKTDKFKNNVKQKMPKTTAFFAKCSAKCKAFSNSVAQKYTEIKATVNRFFDGIFDNIAAGWRKLRLKFSKKSADVIPEANTNSEEDK